MSFINTLTASKAVVANRMRTWFENSPRSKRSSVRENDCTEYLKRRFGIKDFTIVLEDILESRAVKRMQKFKSIERSDSGRHLKSLKINGSDLDQKYGSVVDENDCSGTAFKAVQKDLLKKRPQPSHNMRNENALVKSTQTTQKKRQKKLPLQSYRRRKASPYHLISWKHKQKCSSSTNIFEKNFSSVKYKVTSVDKLDPHNLVRFL